MSSEDRQSLVAAASTPDEPGREDYLVFRIANEFFALAATSLRQILEPPPIVPVPNTPPDMLGVINLRGEILGVLDLRVPFHLGVAGTSEDERLLVLRYRRRSVAVVADAVLSIESLQRRQLEPVPMDLPDLHRRAFLGQVELDEERSVSILDAHSIFTLPHFRVDTKAGGGRAHE